MGSERLIVYRCSNVMKVFYSYFRSFMQWWMSMAWQMSSPYQALQLVCITLASVFLKSSFVSKVPRLCSPVLGIKQIL